MTTAIYPVQSVTDQHNFYNFAWRVYQDDPNWVPHLWPQRKAYLDRKAAFFSYGEGEFWLAKRGREVVGTIGTAIDASQNQHKGWKAALFGFFEVLPGDYVAAQALWDHASQWARARGMEELHGPYSFSGNDDPGFLIEGFECPPAIMMGHNPPYYAEFAAKYGFTKLNEGLAYRYDFSQINFDVSNAPEIIHRVVARARERHGPSAVRSPRLADWDKEIERLHIIYNTSLAVLPEFSPIELVEFRSQAESIKPILDPELVLIAEVGDKPVGFSLGLPNLNEALIHANGLRYPWDYVRLAIAQRKIRSGSFKILAIDPAYWGYGLEGIMFLEMGKRMIEKGYTWADASLTNEYNPQTNKLATRLGARVYRRYREYQIKL
jgi:GNAT superfamily N-acetyltransferase